MKTAENILEKNIQNRLGKEVDVTFTDNVRSMVSFRKEGAERYVLRLHRMFEHASDKILDDIAGWMSNPRKRPESLERFVRDNRGRVRRPSPRKKRNVRLLTKGKNHDLAAYFAKINAEYFDSRLEMRITWGRKYIKKHPLHMRLGFYNTRTGVISISPRLDRRSVPQYFVEYIVYHEMLHAHLGITHTPEGRRQIHTPRFKKLERGFGQFERAAEFEKRFYG